MASTSRLRASLLSNLNSPTSQDDHQAFFERLMSHKSDLVNMYDIGPRSQAEQHEVESGACLRVFSAFSALNYAC